MSTSPMFPAETDARCKGVFEWWEKHRTGSESDYSGLALLLIGEVHRISPAAIEWARKMPDPRAAVLSTVATHNG